MSMFNRLAVIVHKSVKIRNLSTAIQSIPIQEELPQFFRTNESNPVNHNLNHLNKIYTISSNDSNAVFCYGLTPEYQKQIKTFAEFSILIRKPAIELLSYFAQTDYSKPVNKYVLYGEIGCGKSSTLYHALHYGYATKMILVYVPWVQTWFRFPKEVSNSITEQDMLDLPIDAAAWLANFKLQNALLLEEANLKLSKNYEWSSWDSSSKDSSILDMIDLGINRMKYACDILKALLSELKHASTAGKCKVLVAIDGYNAFFSTHTQVKNDLKQKVPASKVSLTEAFLDMTKSDWCNGQIVVTVDQSATKDMRESYLPRYLLTKEGFELLDPFLPICLQNYSQEEFDTIIEYYKNRKWIRHITSEGEKELKLLTNGNPYQLMQYCRHL